MKPKVDSFFQATCMGGAFLGLLLVGAFACVLIFSSWDIWKTQPLELLFSSNWNPSENHYGAAGALIGTLLTTAFALLLAVPLAFATALCILRAPPKIAHPLAQALDLLAAIPSLVYGMWGLFVLCPLVQEGLATIGIETTGFGLFSSSLVLALMILPYIAAIMREVLSQTSTALTEAAYGVGCTSWEVNWHILARANKRGLVGGIFIGLGRALGETMAVLFVCGGITELPHSLFDGCTTLAATIANDFAEATALHKSALFGLGTILFVFSFLIQACTVHLLKDSNEA